MPSSSKIMRSFNVGSCSISGHKTLTYKTNISHDSQRWPICTYYSCNEIMYRATHKCSYLNMLHIKLAHMDYVYVYIIHGPSLTNNHLLYGQLLSVSTCGRADKKDSYQNNSPMI